MTDPRDLYREHIVEHHRNPRNQGTLEGATHRATVSNPLCGDRITVELQLTPDGAVADVRFKARGCAISVASASMMTEWIRGASESARAALRAAVEQAVRPDGGPVEPPVDALLAVRAFPARTRCATIAWEALDEALSNGVSDG